MYHVTEEADSPWKTGPEIQIGQASSEHQVNLVDITDVVEPVGNQLANGGPGFFNGLPPGAFRDGFSVFQVTGRQGPESITGFNRPPAKEDFALPLGDAADHNPGILVVNRAAGSSPEGISKATAEPHRLQNFIPVIPQRLIGQSAMVSTRIQKDIIGIFIVDSGLVDAAGGLRQNDGEREV